MIVGVDLSLQATGVAVYRGRPPHGQLQVHTIDGTKTRGFERVAAVCGQVWKACEGANPLVVIEGYSYNSHVDFGIAELRGVLTYGMWSWAAQMMTVPPANLKQYATGKGNAGKDEVLLAVERRYGHLSAVKDNNQSDALVLVAMALDCYGAPLAGVPERNRAALIGRREPLKWPAYVLDGGGDGR